MSRNTVKPLTPALLASRSRHAILSLRAIVRDINLILGTGDFPNIGRGTVRMSFLTDLKLYIKATECRLVALQMLGEGLAPALTDLLPLDADKV